VVWAESRWQNPTLERRTVQRYDEITPVCAETIHKGIPGSRLRVFEESAHVAHLEETGAYLRTVADFLTQAEAGPSP